MNPEKIVAEIDALLEKGKTQCPFDGKHFSSFGKAVCPWCNPQPGEEPKK